LPFHDFSFRTAVAANTSAAAIVMSPRLQQRRFAMLQPCLQQRICNPAATSQEEFEG